jgi:hypothetical protein
MRHETAGQKRLGIGIVQCIWHDWLIGLSTKFSKFHSRLQDCHQLISSDITTSELLVPPRCLLRDCILHLYIRD